MSISKWVHNGEVKFDVSGVTSTPENTLKGVKTVNDKGEHIEGAVETEIWELTYEDGRVEEVEVAVL